MQIPSELYPIVQAFAKQKESLGVKEFTILFTFPVKEEIHDRFSIPINSRVEVYEKFDFQN